VVNTDSEPTDKAFGLFYSLLWYHLGE